MPPEIVCPMSLISRISLSGPQQGEGAEPEDIFASALSSIFTDDVMNQHGDDEHSLLYTSPRLPRPLTIELAKPESFHDRHLFSHYLWNASLLLAELVERDSLPGAGARGGGDQGPDLGKGVNFNVGGLHVMEVGAGTALPSMMAGLLGARRVCVTDYPTPLVIETLRTNITRNICPELSPLGDAFSRPDILVEGHQWGDVEGGVRATADHHAFDRLFVCDCLWMPWQHDNLHRSVSHFLRVDAAARAWVVAGFHTGRAKMKGFFEAAVLAEFGLEVERMWEQDCDGKQRAWTWDHDEDPTARKRWLVVASLRRTSQALQGLDESPGA